MTDRDQDREWLLRGAEKQAEGWEADMIKTFGMEGALDLLALQAGRVSDVDLRRAPFRRDAELKFLTREAQEAVAALQRRAYEVWWEIKVGGERHE